MKGFVVAGERSGTGKTLITLALARACMRRGMRVQCFKVGPDFIDPGYHSAVTGRSCRNLDGWMMDRRWCTNTFSRAATSADLAIVEGVMGLYDGYDGTSQAGSTAQIATWLDLPVIVVIDGGALARTAGAVALGLELFDPGVNIAGVMFNRVAGPRHFTYLKDAVEEKCTSRVLGYLPRSPAWHVPERHLGLTMAGEHCGLSQKADDLSGMLEKTVDVSGCISLAGIAADNPAAKEPPDSRPAPSSTVRIGVARDDAFCFYYQDNLDLLKDSGAEIVPFSPMHDPAPPEGIRGLYLGGGYPELYAGHLSRNAAMRSGILSLCRSGMPVYGECGGFLYLLESITDSDGKPHAMAGLFPARASMRPQLQRLGYVEVEALDGCPFLVAGTTARGHEFHYSEVSDMPSSVQRCYSIAPRRGDSALKGGYRLHNTLAGYTHLHFASCPDFPDNFLHMCAAHPPG